MTGAGPARMRSVCDPEGLRMRPGEDFRGSTISGSANMVTSGDAELTQRV